MPQEPGATIRVDGELYKELRAIAEARDCSLRQAMDFWVDRRVKVRTIGKSRIGLDGGKGGAKKVAKPRASKPKERIKPRASKPKKRIIKVVPKPGT